MSEEIKKEQEVKQEEIQNPTEAVKDQSKEQAEAEGKGSEKNKPKAEVKKDTKKDTGKKEKLIGKKAGVAAKAEQKQEKEKSELPPISYKPLASSSKNTAIHSLMVQVKNGKLNLQHEVQRKSEQWDFLKKSKFLHSLIIGVISPEIVVCEKDGQRFVVDGKQRLSCLNEYINKKDTKLTVFDRKFDELDDATKDALTGSNINVVTYANCSDQQIFELFERYNNGVSLSGSQKSRSYCTIAMLTKIKGILDKDFFKVKANITKGQELKDEDTMVLIQSAMLVSNFDLKSFSQKEVDRYLQETAEQEIMATLEDVEKRIDILDKMLENQKYKNLKKIHLPMIISATQETEAFKVKLLDFLEDYENESNSDIQEYRSHCQGSTSQKEHVQGRLKFWTNV